MANNHKIEKNIPITNRSWGIWAKLANDMQDGDSVLVHNRNEQMNLRNAIVNLGFSAVTRKQDKDLVRVWKIKK